MTEVPIRYYYLTTTMSGQPVEVLHHYWDAEGAKQLQGIWSQALYSDPDLPITLFDNDESSCTVRAGDIQAMYWEKLRWPKPGSSQ